MNGTNSEQLPPFADGGGGGPPTEGLTDAEYDASVATLESVAATLNAKCVVLREKRLDESGKRTETPNPGI